MLPTRHFRAVPCRTGRVWTMSADEQHQFERPYHAALKRRTDERAEFIAETCGGNAEFREQLEPLLGQTVMADGPLDHPAWEGAADLLADKSVKLINSRYQIVEQLG